MKILSFFCKPCKILVLMSAFLVTIKVFSCRIVKNFCSYCIKLSWWLLLYNIASIVPQKWKAKNPCKISYHRNKDLLYQKIFSIVKNRREYGKNFAQKSCSACSFYKAEVTYRNTDFFCCYSLYINTISIYIIYYIYLFIFNIE